MSDENDTEETMLSCTFRGAQMAAPLSAFPYSRRLSKGFDPMQYIVVQQDFDLFHDGVRVALSELRGVLNVRGR
jgi:hypothetical protein